MTSTYAEHAELVARLSSAYTVTEDDSAQLLLKASELVDYATQGMAELAWTSETYEDDDYDFLRTAVTNATCDQVEYWLEVGEEHDVVGLRGSMIAGRVQVQRLPPALGQRAARTLMQAGLLWSGAAVSL